MEGLATNDTLDLDGQIIDKDFARTELRKWFEDWGNVRQMHSNNLPPAGKAVEFEEVPGGFWVKSLVVEPTARKLVKEGVYSAYSVGIAKPRIVRDQVAKNGRVVGGIFSEISLVDFPANPTCRFTMAKMLDTGLEVVEKVETPDLTKRDFDKGTGGGVDRDKLPDEDFAGPDRSFPIVTPGDVADAAHLVGKADDPDAVKAKIISIARRKGGDFTAKLPDDWKTDKSESADLVKASGKIPVGTHVTWHYRGAIGHGTITGIYKDNDDPEKVEYSIKETDHHDGEPDVLHHFGSALTVGKAGRADWKDGKPPFPGAAKPFGKKDDEDGDDDKDDDKAEKRRDAKRGLESHREPDGDEHGPDVDDDVAKSVPYFVKRLHDATCPAYSEGDVLVEHPSLGAGMAGNTATDWFAGQVAKMATAGDTENLPAVGAAYGAALAVDGMDPAVFDDSIAGLRKAFAEYCPDVHVTPTDVEPSGFHRGFVGTGRAQMHAGSGPRIPLASRVPDPANFRKGDPEVAAAKAALGAVESVHDFVVTKYPAICPIERDGLLDAANGSSLQVAMPTTDTLPTRSAAMPVAVADDTMTAVQAGLDPEIIKHLVADATREATAELADQVSALTKRLADYEAQPDPAASAPRNATAVPELTKTHAGAGAGDAGVDADQVSDLVRLVKRARSHDTTVSLPAVDKLMKLVGPQAVADLI